MPVKKFKDVESMNQARWREPGSRELYHAIRYVWELGQRTTPREFPPGIYKHRSVDAAQVQREQWAVAHIARLQAARSR